VCIDPAYLAKVAQFRLLGESILDSGFAFDLEVRMGAGAFV
jgi:NADH:ubiquinone oxidoreductase subunit F (NADH-binding)